MDFTTCNLLHMTLQCALCISKFKKKSREIKKKERKKDMAKKVEIKQTLELTIDHWRGRLKFG